jgi:hypothetical protein
MQNKICGFLLQVLTSFLTLPKIVFLIMDPSSLDLHSLGSPKSHHQDSKPTRIQKLKINKVP